MFSWIKKLFSRVIREAWKFIKKAYPKVMIIIISEYGKFAVSIIKDLEVEDITNPAKRRKAFKLIRAEARRRGKRIKTRMVYQLIEDVLAVIRGEK